MKSYTVMPAKTAAPLCGDPCKGPWADAGELLIEEFPWYAEGLKQLTRVKLLYDEAALYGQFRCEDAAIFAEVTELNGNVCLDSCVEFFASYDPAAGPDYFNIEMNCCGNFLMGHGPARRPRSSITPELAEKVEIITSVAGPTKDESPDDDGWWAAFRLPLEVAGAMAARSIAPAAGDRWRANFFRCGGRSHKQFAQWNPIDTGQWPRPDFHRPEYFGELLFG